MYRVHREREREIYRVQYIEYIERFIKFNV